MENKFKKSEMWMTLFFFLMMLSLFFLIGAKKPQITEKTKAPYLLSGEMKKNVKGLENAFEYEMKNLSDKTICEYQLILSLFDYDGEPALQGDYVTLDVKEKIQAGNYSKNEIDLSPYLFENPEDVYLIDYFYASRVVFDDGTVFEDPFGRLQG